MKRCDPVRKWCVRERDSSQRHFASSSRHLPQELNLDRGCAAKDPRSAARDSTSTSRPRRCLGPPAGTRRGWPAKRRTSSRRPHRRAPDGRSGVSEPFLGHERLHELLSHTPSFDIEEDAMFELGVHRPRQQLQFAASVCAAKTRRTSKLEKSSAKTMALVVSAKKAFSDATANLAPLSFCTYLVVISKHW